MQTNIYIARKTSINVYIHLSDYWRGRKLKKIELYHAQFKLSVFQTVAKFAVLKQRRILKGRKLFFNGDLTIANKVLFDRARKDLSHLAVRTTDGKVLVKLADDKIIRIKANEDIANLCLKSGLCTLL
jgi:hypothetical protein